MVLHEFTITMALKDVNESIEKLNINDYYNLYYDQPIEQIPEENGSGFIEVQNTSIELKVILEDSSEVSVEKSKAEIGSILHIEEDLISYQLLEMPDWQ